MTLVARDQCRLLNIFHVKDPATITLLQLKLILSVLYLTYSQGFREFGEAPWNPLGF